MTVSYAMYAEMAEMLIGTNTSMNVLSMSSETIRISVRTWSTVVAFCRKSKKFEGTVCVCVCVGGGCVCGGVMCECMWGSGM